MFKSLNRNEQRTGKDNSQNKYKWLQNIKRNNFCSTNNQMHIFSLVSILNLGNDPGLSDFFFLSYECNTIKFLVALFVNKRLNFSISECSWCFHILIQWKLWNFNLCSLCILTFANYLPHYHKCRGNHIMNRIGSSLFILNFYLMEVSGIIPVHL